METTTYKIWFNVVLEKTVRIRNAPVIVDVFAVLDGKKYLIEIGDIADKRKFALMEIYAEQNSNTEFIHEGMENTKFKQCCIQVHHTKIHQNSKTI